MAKTGHGSPSEQAKRAGLTVRGALLGLWQAVRAAWNGFFERRVPMMAAGLAFYFLLGLIPFLFLVAASSGYFLKNNPGIYAQMTATIIEILPPGIGERILVHIQDVAGNWRTMGAVGLGTLFLVAMGLFDALDEGINAVMGAQKKVGFLTGRIISLAYVVGSILFFSVAAVAGYSLNLVSDLAFFKEHPAFISFFTGRYFSIGVFAVFLLGLYMIFPVKTPKFHQAVVMALVVTGAWRLLQELGQYITAGIVRRQAIYGALAGAALFLTWMYLLALLILLGARILDFWRGSTGGAPIDADEKM